MKSKIKLSISGNKPEHFLFKIHSNKINIENITKINKNKIEIIINYSDYEKLIAINTIYDIKILEYLGIVKSKKLIIKYRHMIIIFFLCILGISFFSNIIFKVEIITNDLDMKKNLSLTLAKYNIDKFHLKKDYHYINKVKEKILEEYHDEIEWIEIENIGTKYLVRYEPRILKEQSKKKHFQHVIAKKCYYKTYPSYKRTNY